MIIIAPDRADFKLSQAERKTEKKMLDIKRTV